MPKQIIVFIAIFLAVMLQVSFFPAILSGKAFPDIALIAVIFWAARSGFEAAWPRAIISGLMLDFLYFWPIGINVFSFVSIAFGISYLAKRFLVKENLSRFFTLAALLILGTVINEMLIVAIMRGALNEVIDFRALFISKDLALKIFYNLLVLLAIYVPLLKLENFIAAYEPGPKPIR